MLDRARQGEGHRGREDRRGYRAPHPWGAAAPDRAECQRGGLHRPRQGARVEGHFGYNAATDEYEDLVKAGVIDPTKGTRTALQNAASIAGLLLTTECVVVEKKEDKPAPAGGPPGGGMGGMY